MMKKEQQIQGSILLFQRIVAHYRVPIFEELYRRFGIIVCHSKERKKSTLRDEGDSLNVPLLRVRRWYPFKKDSVVVQDVLTPCLKFKPKIIIIEFSLGIISNLMLLFLRRILGFRIILWTFGYNPHSGFDPQRLSDRLRLCIYNSADAVIFYWERGKNMIIPYVKNTKNLFVAPNTLDTRKLVELRNFFENEGIQAIKKKLGLNKSKLLIYVGRLIPDKQVEVLIEAFSIIRGRLSGCGLVIVGDGPCRSHLESIVSQRKLNDVYFMGEIKEQKKVGELLYISDIMVIPGRLGLAVVHSYCFDTPVISQDKENFFHGEGIGYLKNGETGFLVSDGNIQELVDKIFSLLTDCSLAQCMKKNIRKVLNEECSIERMMDGFKQAIEFVSK